MGAPSGFAWLDPVALLCCAFTVAACSDDGNTVGTDPDGSTGSGGAAGSSGTAGSGAATTGGSSGAGGSTNTDAGSGASPDAGDGASPNVATPDTVWSPLSVMAIVDPLDHGAAGDGVADDLAALGAAVAALPDSGGIVYLREGMSFRKSDLLIVTKSHVKFWAPERQAALLQDVNGTRRRQSILCRQNVGCGFFGLELVSDATARFDALEDNQISADHGSLIEIVGCEVNGSAASGIFLYGSTEHYIHGNYIHHTWADHVHHTDGARQSWVWNNFVFNEEPSRGDDGVACVTYGPTSPTCGDMEWWNNTILHTDWGRGYSVIGGDAISIHDNWAIGVAGAGIIVASEPSYDSATSHDIAVRNNVVYGCGHSIGHPGILVSGLNTAAAPLSNLTFIDNVSVDNPGGPYRAEGSYSNVTNEGLLTTSDALPQPVPTTADIRLEDTSILRTRDVSHVEESFRTGLHRIHVRPNATRNGFEERFEYVVKGPPDTVRDFTDGRAAAGDYVSETRTVSASAYALVLTRAPVAVPAELSGVPFRELRDGDADGTLAWLWTRIDTASY